MTTKIPVDEIKVVVEQNVGPVLVKAIQDGYSAARVRLAEFDLEAEFQPAAYGQLLFFAVQQQVFRIELMHPEFRTVAKPNDNRSAYHTETRFRDLLITVEAVADCTSRPRRAGFRSDLAKYQMRFDVVAIGSHQEFRMQPASLPAEPYAYLHILHGREEGKEELAFVLAVFENEHHEYFSGPIVLYQRPDVGTEQIEIEKVEEEPWF